MLKAILAALGHSLWAASVVLGADRGGGLCPATVVMCLCCGAYGDVRVDRLAFVCARVPRSVGSATRLKRFLKGLHLLSSLVLSPPWRVA